MYRLLAFLDLTVSVETASSHSRGIKHQNYFFFECARCPSALVLRVYSISKTGHEKGDVSSTPALHRAIWWRAGVLETSPFSWCDKWVKLECASCYICCLLFFCPAPASFLMWMCMLLFYISFLDKKKYDSSFTPNLSHVDVSTTVEPTQVFWCLQVDKRGLPYNVAMSMCLC